MISGMPTHQVASPKAAPSGRVQVSCTLQAQPQAQHVTKPRASCYTEMTAVDLWLEPAGCAYHCTDKA